MKRDMDLAREILIEAENHPYKGYEGDGSTFVPVIAGYTPETIGYHVMLLEQAGLIEANRVMTMDGKVTWRTKQLTWHGHEFLDAARNQNIWGKVKKVAQEQGGSLPFDVLKALAIQFARQAVGL